MSIPYVTDDDVLTHLKAEMHVIAFDSSGTEAWEEIVEKANISAYEDIISELANRGYSIEQIDTWRRREEFNRDIACYYALVKGGAVQNYDKDAVARLDRRPELKTVPVLLED